MAMQGSYPMNGRSLAGTDTTTGVVTGATADIPLATLATFILGPGGTGQLSGPTANRPNPPSYISQPYLDTTLGFMVWCKQISPVIWINAAGVSV